VNHPLRRSLILVVRRHFSNIMKSSFIFLFIANAVIFFIATLIARLINHLAKRNVIAPKNLGLIAVSFFSFILILLIYLSMVSGISSSPNADPFNQGVVYGGLMGDVIFPGVIFILIAWFFTRKNAPKSNQVTNQVQLNSAKAEPIKQAPKSIGDKIATGVFWFFAGGLILLLLIGVLNGS
jgi:hypothetical protein